MNKKVLNLTFLLIFSAIMLSCSNKSNAQNQTAVTDENKIQVYGVKSGYYKAEMPINESVAETWFDDYGRLQYIEIQTIGDPIKSYKLVRNDEEYYFSDYNKNGIKKQVTYTDYRTWENPKMQDLEKSGIRRMPSQMIFGKACKTYYVSDPQLPSVMCFWKGILMVKILDDGTVMSEVVDLRETAVPSNMFDIPQDINFEEIAAPQLPIDSVMLE